MKWDKSTFVADMREKCSREVAKIGNDICEFQKTMQQIFPGVVEMIMEH